MSHGLKILNGVYLFHTIIIYRSAELVDNSWLYMRTYLMDGFFGAEHLKMKNPEDDVILNDGLSFFVKEGPFRDYIKRGKQFNEVTPYRQQHATYSHNLPAIAMLKP